MATPSSAPVDPGKFVWWFPGSPIRVHLTLDVVRRLTRQLQIAGAKAAGEGLLLGRSAEGATEVLDFQPAPGRVRETAETMAEGGKHLLVGYYRIENGDLRLNEADVQLDQACFGKPYHVFLLIQPTGFGAPNASFFVHDTSGRIAEFSLMEFPFESSLLADEERDRVKRSQEAATRRLAAVEPPKPPPPPRGRSRPVLVAAAGTISTKLLSFCLIA